MVVLMYVGCGFFVFGSLGLLVGAFTSDIL